MNWLPNNTLLVNRSELKYMYMKATCEYVYFVTCFALYHMTVSDDNDEYVVLKGQIYAALLGVFGTREDSFRVSKDWVPRLSPQSWTLGYHAKNNTHSIVFGLVIQTTQP